MEIVEVKSRHHLVGVYDFVERLFILYIPGILLVFMCLFVAAEVLFRLIVNYSFLGVIDLVEQIVVMVTFLSLGGVQRERSHITVDVLPNKLSSRRAGLILDCIFLALSILVMGVLLVMASWYWIVSFKGRALLMALVWPKWPFMLAMPLGIFFMLLRLVIQFRESFLRSISKRPLEGIG